MPALVSALKRVDLPTFGSPTMPHFTLFLSEEGFQQPAAGRPSRLGCGRRLVCRRRRGCRGTLGRGRLNLFRLLGLARRAGAVQLLHGALQIARDAKRQDAEGAFDRLVDRRAVLRRRTTQHIARDGVLVAGMADADAKPPVVVRPHALRDVAQAVVPADAAALLEPRDARRKVELVVRDEDLFGPDLEEAGEHLHGTPA